MKNLKKLSRNELRNVKGGKACTLVTHNPNGTYTTTTGTCQYHNSFELDGGGHLMIVTSGGFCNTGNGVEHDLTSNGGVSHCND